jgi:hypothetical protein
MSLSKARGKLEKLLRDVTVAQELAASASFLDHLEGIEDDTDREIRLHEAQWVLDKFLTVNVKIGQSIERLRREMDKYVLQKNPERPFVAAICAKPGAGKSTLARDLAYTLGCEFIDTNVAQWRNIDDLYLVCERIRTIQITKRGIRPVVFIDEVDSEIEGGHVYQRLLAPIWDQAYVYQGVQREIGPAIFLLAGSSEDWENGRNLAAANPQDDSKLKDLVSRLSTSPLTIPPLFIRSGFFNLTAGNRVDAVYSAVYHLRKRFPNANSVDLRVMRFLTCNTLLHDTRSIVQAVKTLSLMVDTDLCIVHSNRNENADSLSLHIEMSAHDLSSMTPLHQKIEVKIKE